MGICSPEAMREIESRNRRGHVKRNLILARQHGDSVRADFVGGVAIARDAVGAHHDGADSPVFRKWPTMLSVIRVSGMPS